MQKAHKPLKYSWVIWPDYCPTCWMIESGRLIDPKQQQTPRSRETLTAISLERVAETFLRLWESLSTHAENLEQCWTFQEKSAFTLSNIKIHLMTQVKKKIRNGPTLSLLKNFALFILQSAKCLETLHHSPKSRWLRFARMCRPHVSS